MIAEACVPHVSLSDDGCDQGSCHIIRNGVVEIISGGASRAMLNWNAWASIKAYARLSLAGTLVEDEPCGGH